MICFFGRRRRHRPVASVGALVEVIQHGGVGSLKQPLLAERGRVARVHEDPPLARAAVDTAVTDRVIQTLVLQDGGRERERQEGMKNQQNKAANRFI